MSLQTLQSDFSLLCKKIYPYHILLKKIINEDEFFLFLKENRLDHFFAVTYINKYKSDNKTFVRFKALIDEYDTYTKKVSGSLRKIKSQLGNGKLLIIKTFSSYPHITGDIDCLLENTTDVNKLRKLSLSYPTDFNTQISWTYDREISTSYVWDNVQSFTFKGTSVYVPNNCLDVLIRIAHFPFELAKIRLGELLHIFSLAKSVDWKSLRQQSVENNWHHTYDSIYSALNNLHRTIYRTDLTTAPGLRKFQMDAHKFPYKIPYRILIRAVLEKKAWNKIWGARYIFKERLHI